MNVKSSNEEMSMTLFLCFFIANTWKWHNFSVFCMHSLFILRM